MHIIILFIIIMCIIISEFFTCSYVGSKLCILNIASFADMLQLTASNSVYMFAALLQY